MNGINTLKDTSYPSALRPSKTIEKRLEASKMFYSNVNIFLRYTTDKKPNFYKRRQV